MKLVWCRDCLAARTRLDGTRALMSSTLIPRKGCLSTFLALREIPVTPCREKERQCKVWREKRQGKKRKGPSHMYEDQNPRASAASPQFVQKMFCQHQLHMHAREAEGGGEKERKRGRGLANPGNAHLSLDPRTEDPVVPSTRKWYRTVMLPTPLCEGA